MLVLSITLRLLGVDSILAENGSDLNIQALVILSGVIGFGGSFISLCSGQSFLATYLEIFQK